MSAAKARVDPFGLGMTASEVGLARTACPYPEHFVEGRQWLTGWDYRTRRVADRLPLVPGR
jgi:ribosome modulation factor